MSYDLEINFLHPLFGFLIDCKQAPGAETDVGMDIYHPDWHVTLTVTLYSDICSDKSQMICQAFSVPTLGELLTQTEQPRQSLDLWLIKSQRQNHVETILLKIIWIFYESFGCCQQNCWAQNETCLSSVIYNAHLLADFISSERSSYSEDVIVLIYYIYLSISISKANFVRFSLSPLIQLMLQDLL